MSVEWDFVASGIDGTLWGNTVGKAPPFVLLSLCHARVIALTYYLSLGHAYM
jgi:hypothetical protein